MLYSFVFPQLVERLDYNAMKSILLPGWGESSINENKDYLWNETDQSWDLKQWSVEQGTHIDV